MKKQYLTKNQGNKGFIDIYGIHSVSAALANPRRNHQKLVISDSNKGLINQKIKKIVPKIIQISNKEIANKYGNFNNHQGIILTTSLLTQPSLEDLLKKTSNNEIEIVLMLDQLTDPNNIGSIMRSSALFKCNNIIVSKDNSPDITPTMAKAASGALEVINYIKVTNLSRSIKKFKENNFWVCGLESNNKNTNKLEIPKKCLLVLGAEGKGLRDLTKKHCDELISIPTTLNSTFKIDSLNVSNACSIALYEHYIKKI